jgi:hypothetical protein
MEGTFTIINMIAWTVSLPIIHASTPEVDENGYTRMQLWSFMELYGPYISMTQPNVIDPIEIIIEEE